MDESYFKIELSEVDPKESFNIKSIRFCMCCHQIVDNVGAGDGFICKPCKHILDTGALSSVFSEIKKIIKDGIHSDMYIDKLEN